MRSCVTCKWAAERRPDGSVYPYGDCQRPAGGYIDPVTGINGNSLKYERRGGFWSDRCGKQGRYWEPREEESQP